MRVEEAIAKVTGDYRRDVELLGKAYSDTVGSLASLMDVLDFETIMNCSDVFYAISRDATRRLREAAADLLDDPAETDMAMSGIMDWFLTNVDYGHPRDHVLCAIWVRGAREAEETIREELTRLFGPSLTPGIR